MSIANLFCQGNRAFLVSDSGYFWRDGRIAWLQAKVLELPEARAAITVRGHISAPRRLGPILAARGISSLADVIRAVPQVVHDELARDGAFASHRSERSHAHEVYVAYYDRERDRAGGLLMSSSNTGMPVDYDPWSWMPVREVTSPGVDMLTALGRDGCPTDPQFFDPVTDSIAVATAQRRSSWAFHEHKRAHYVAGALRLTVVGPLEISTQEIHSWPDRVGFRVRADLDGEPCAFQTRVAK